MLRIRSTAVEMFRTVTEPPFWGLERELVAFIRGGQKDTPGSKWQMRAGTAWHSALAWTDEEIARRARAADWTADGGEFCFRPEDVAAGRKATGPGRTEVPGEIELAVGGTRVLLTGTADHLRGLVCRDHKTVFGTPDVRDYETRFQWRAYLLIHQVRAFRYLLWAFRGPKEDGLLEMRAATGVTFWPYPGLEADVRGRVAEFLAWVRVRGLTKYLEAAAAVWAA